MGREGADVERRGAREGGGEGGREGRGGREEGKGEEGRGERKGGEGRGEREERLVWVKVDVRTLGIGLLCDAHAGKRDQTYVLW